MMNHNVASIQTISIPVAKPNALRRLNAVITSVVLGILALLGLYALLSWQPNTVMAAENVVLQPETSLSLKRNATLGLSKFLPPSKLASSILMAFPPLQIEDDVVTTTITFTIGSDTDDSSYHPTGFDLYDPDDDCNVHFGNYLANEIYLGRCDYDSNSSPQSTPITSGLRFEGITIPDNATLVNAYLNVHFEGGYTRDIPKTNIYGEASANSHTFSEGDLPDDRVISKTISYASWSTNDDWTTAVGFYNSPPLVDVVAEIMNTPGWVDGNPITFLLMPDGCITPSGKNACEEGAGAVHIRFRSWDFPDQENEFAPQLVLVYTETRKVNTEISTLIAEPLSVVADGIEFITITTTLSDTYGPLVNRSVALSSTGPISTSWPNGNQTDANGQVIAYITSTHPQTTSISAIALNEGVTLSQTAVVTFTDVPIQGLAAEDSSPTPLGETTTFTATVSQGTSVIYEWNFGDGNTGSGHIVDHTYAAAGNYTAVVTASNSVNLQTTSTGVTINEPPTGPDLTIAKTGPSEVAAGALIIYDITVTNQGDEAAANVVVTDTLPVSTTFVGSSPEYISLDENTGTVVWAIDYLSGGKAKTFTLQAQVDSDIPASTPITNTVFAAFSGADPSSEDSHTVTIASPPPGPDLFVYKTGPANVPAGFPIEYEITVANQGGTLATGIVVTDTLPISTTFVSSDHEWNTAYDAATGNVVFNIRPLAAGDSYNITIQALVSDTAPIGNIINTAVGTINENETNQSNNQAYFTTAVLEPAPQLTIEPANDGSNAAVLSVLQGTTASMIITATNTGTSPLLGGLSLTRGNDPYDINYSWLEITPLTTNDIAVGDYVTFTVNVTDNGLANGSYYDLFAIDSNDPSVPSEPFFLKVYVHPPLVDFTVPITNTMDNPVSGASVDFTKTTSSVVFLEGVESLDHADTYFQRVIIADSNGLAVMSQMETGDYDYEISASGHQSVNGVVTVPDDLVNGQFLPSPLLALPGLEFEPNQATLSVVAGESAYFTLRVRNHGPGHAENFTVATPVDLPWISSGLPYGVTQLLAGEAMSVTLFLNPPATNTLDLYTEYITVTADYVEPGYLAAAINVLDEPNGSLDFTITGPAGAPVQDARVVITNESGRVVDGPNGQEVVYDTKSATTDANGQVTLTDLPPAEYSYHIDADSYYLETGATEVWPGSAAQGENDNQVNVQLTTDPFSYEWTVEETDIIDTYAITVEITYEAGVVEPLLYVSHAQFCPGEDVQYLVANMGPVTMTDVVLTPNHDGVNFAVAPVTISELVPGQAYIDTFTTSGISGQDAASSGAFNVTAVYQSQTGSVNYATSNRTTKYCPSDSGGSGGGWSWYWDNGHPVGTYTGERPSFPGGESPPAPSDSGQEAARLILSGDAVLERQAFNARLQLDSLSLDVVEDITINIEARDESGQAVVNGFAVTPTLPTLLGDLAAGGSLVGEWLIVPGDLGITDTNGAVYDLRAQIVYTWNGTVYTTTTVPQPITVYPQPYVRLNYSHTQPDENGDFYVEISARNDGYGAARNLVLDLSDVTVLEDLDGNGRSLLFELKETMMDGVPVGGDILEYAFHFDDIEPGQTKTGRWLIGVSAGDGAELVNQVVTGFKVSCEHLPYQGLTLSPLLNCGETVQPYLTYDCPFCGMGDTSATVGGPINTANGNYTYQQGTPRINAVGNPLQFTWTYNSLNSGISPDYPLFSSALGLGWTHNYQVALDLSQVNGPEHAAVVRAPHGTPMYFHVVRDGYEPAPGVHATMTSTEIAPNQTVYTVTTGSQATFVFTDTGQLLRQIDAKGNVLEFSYNALGQLERVEEPISGRFLTFSYVANGRLTTVTDPINRTTQFGYNPLGHLTAVTDTRDLVWPYGYTQVVDDHYLLSRIEDPDGRLIEETGFDNYGRAITQTYMGQDLSIVYFNDGRRLITDGLEQETIHIYNQQDLLVAAADTAEQLNTYVLDGYNNRTYVEDRNSNPTWYDKTPFGYTTAITDALDNATYLEYDAYNNWTRREDARGEITLYEYEHNNLITETNHLSDTVTYTYNQWGQMTSVTDENDVATRYGFDEIGQLTVITNSQGMTTTFEYDEVGRLITATNAMNQVTVNVYDKADNLIQTTENYLAGQPQNYLEMYNIVTQYGYDGVGHQIAITDTLGRVNLTLYNEFGQVVTGVVNYDGVAPLNALCADFSAPDPEYNICSLTEYDELGRVIATTDSLGRIDRTFYDDQGRVVGTIDNWSGTITDIASLPSCLDLPQNRDHDICTLYGHDAVGNSTVMTDTVGRVTRTFYDPLNRIDGMIMNWDGQTTLDNCLTLPAERDNNVCMRFGYDEVGNTIIVTDTLGQMTRTFYDELGRTSATVANWNPATLASPAQCVLSPDNDSEENICSLTEYDAVGSPTVTTNALEQRNLTVYDDANRPFIQVANWDGTTIITDIIHCQFPPAQPDSNLCTATLYDEQGRPYATVDPLGGETQMGYDEVGRVVTTTRILDGVPVQTTMGYDAAGRRANQTDANGHTTTFFYDSLNRPLVTVSPGSVAITQTYDALGRVLSTTNNLNQVTTMVYDELDRLIQNQDAEDNITAYEYDVLGNQVAITDANNIRTSYEYDGLQRLVQVTENDTGGSQTNDSNLVTRYAYDVLGNQISIINARNLTSTHIAYDALYRPIVTTDALGNETHVQYNALGARTVITDANDAVTRYQYDDLNRPITITYEADGQTVSYEYNALGSRLAMHDELGTTSYQYDDLYRLAVVTDTFDAVIGYEYDLVGNRTGITYPPSVGSGQAGKVVTYTYDFDNRLDTVTDWNDGLTDYAYDGIGRLITTTLPNGVHVVNQYDDANHLLSLTYTTADDSLLAEYLYEVDGVGNRQVVTETLYAPGMVSTVESYLEENGLIVMEAEKGATTPGATGHEWLNQTAQPAYAGTGYLRAMPDTDELYEAPAASDSPRLTFQLQNNTPANYTVWVRGMAPDAAGDSLHVGVNDQPATTADNLTGLTNEWGWSRLTMDNAPATMPLTTTGSFTVNVWMREDGLRIDRLLLVTDTNYIPTGMGPAESLTQVVTNTVAPGLTSHVIQYAYDDVYRLTDAVYTGDITATFQYNYDPVGNMTAYTDTVGMQTTRVTRYFDDANRLQTSFDYDAGSTSYLYDNNGNLTLIIPPNGGNWQHYGFNQRNLMITHTLSVSGTNPQLQAEYAYDGAGNRVRQVDFTGASPVTTSYTNDIAGLTQVLVADDGTEQIYNLFGLDLIGQSDSTNVRYLLADGLGSVRTEMVGETVESVTTYDPYGNLLTQTGNSGTTYGYTGEQFDDATDLLYLRARYYNPALRSFMGRDPWNGNMRLPQSMNGWGYVENNPINRIDTNGMRSFPYYCGENSGTIRQYVECVTDAFNVEPPFDMGEWEDFFILSMDIIKESGLIEDGYNINWPTDTIHGGPNCYEGPVPYRGDGHYETKGNTEAFKVSGEQIVYDFASLTRNRFVYSGDFISDDMSGSRFSFSDSVATGSIYHFRSWQDVNSDYSGAAAFYYVGIGPGAGYAISEGIEWSTSLGTMENPDPTIQSRGRFFSYGTLTGISLGDFGAGVATYEPFNVKNSSLYYEDYKNDDYTARKAVLIVDIMRGDGSPIPWWAELHSILRYVNGNRIGAAIKANKYANVFEDMHSPWSR